MSTGAMMRKLALSLAALMRSLGSRCRLLSSRLLLLDPRAGGQGDSDDGGQRLEPHFTHSHSREFATKRWLRVGVCVTHRLPGGEVRTLGGENQEFVSASV